MKNEGMRSLAGRRHRPTQWIKRLLATQLKLFRLEVVGQDHPALIRVGALLVFGPFLLVGYAFALAAVVRALAIRLGWSVGLLLVGLIHLAVGVRGMRRGRAIAFAQSYDVLAPDCEPALAADDGTTFETAVTLVNLQPPFRLRRPCPY
jgi:Putative Actinobacterial Holin-X, holin superfamily III